MSQRMGQRKRLGRYAGALLAMGLGAGVALPAARAEDNAQAIEPVNVGAGGGGEQKQMDAAVPVAPAAPATVPAATPGAAESAAAQTAPATPPTEAPAAAVAQPPQPSVAPPPATETAVTPPVTTPATQPAPPPATAPAVAEQVPASSALATAQDGKSYPVTGIKINYYKEQPQQPPIQELLNTKVKLGVTKDGLVAPHPGMPTVTLRLADVGTTDLHRIYRSGIESVYLQIVRFFNARGIIGVFVVVDSKDIDANDNDIRPADRTTLQFIVVTSTVKQVRTLATGDMVAKGDRVNNPRYAAIKAHSPLQADRGDLLNKDALDEYVLRLNRQPGRRVDVAVSGTGELGGVDLDYLVAENRPWYVYAQVSNTGTAQTNVWRERVGVVDNQLTGHNDILTLDYSTAGFDASQALIGSYELPVLGLDRLRYRVYGSWNEYTASDVGQSQETFTGNEWTVGNEVTMNVYQHQDLFVDTVGGFRFQHVHTNGVNGAGNALYFSPYLSLKMERVTDLASTTASATLVGFFTDADKKTDIEPLGRSNVEQNSLVLQVEAAQSMYIEPLLNPQAFAAGKSTLAHELYFGVHGQYAFDYRLIPQDEDVAGGLYSVRGYPESIVAGDTVFVVTSEYRLHIPRLFPIQPDPTKTPFLWDKSFRFSPQQAYGHPDWDLIARAFVDVGRVLNTDALPTDVNSTLVGTGVGLELQYKQNFNIRCDWGVALNDIAGTGDKDEVNAGSNRFHISATILY